ncbi:hypothetical protein MP228_002393 [Amoeboaphelidium protococcarum]|nr:hypothetical protein MP228_002393 [Amoeboaphelidium protococcarum]
MDFQMTRWNSFSKFTILIIVVLLILLNGVVSKPLDASNPQSAKQQKDRCGGSLLKKKIDDKIVAGWLKSSNDTAHTTPRNVSVESLHLPQLPSSQAPKCQASSQQSDGQSQNLVKRSVQDYNEMIYINTYLNVFCARHSFCPDAQVIVPQVQELNNAFRPANIQFVIADARVITDDQFASVQISMNDYDDGSGSVNPRIQTELRDMLKAYRRGTVKDLNIYITQIEASEKMGVTAVYPQDLVHDRAKRQVDGIVLDWQTLPGIQNWYSNIPFLQYTQGKTLVHEVGHWLGLLHTYTDSCDQTDFPQQYREVYGVQDDTPSEFKYSHFDSRTCSQFRSCDFFNFKPIHNYMSYLDDDCLREFTYNQIKLMRAIWYGVRVPLSFDHAEHW